MKLSSKIPLIIKEKRIKMKKSYMYIYIYTQRNIKEIIITQKIKII